MAAATPATLGPRLTPRLDVRPARVVDLVNRIDQEKSLHVLETLERRGAKGPLLRGGLGAALDLRKIGGSGRTRRDSSAMSVPISARTAVSGSAPEQSYRSWITDDDLGDRPSGLQPPPDLGRRRIEAVVIPVGEVDDDRCSVDDLADDACFIDRVALGVTHEPPVYRGARLRKASDPGKMPFPKQTSPRGIWRGARPTGALLRRTSRGRRPDRGDPAPLTMRL